MIRFILSSMPPLWRYWPVYFLVIIVAFGLVLAWYTFIHDQTSDGATAPILFAGVAVAALAIIANTWSQWQTSRISHALQGLQTLRTDREYLINMAVVRDTIAKPAALNADGTLCEALQAKFLDRTNTSADVDKPTFRDATLFVLNQYEFLAAAARSGAIDIVLMRETMRGPISQFLTVFAPAIIALRAENKKAYLNLIWLNETMQGSRNKPYLGPRF